MAQQNLCFSESPIRLWGPPCLLLNWKLLSFSGVKQPRREANHSSLSTTKVKNVCIHTPHLPLHACMVRTATILHFLISNFCRVLNIVCFLLGNSPASEFYMPTFRNTLFHLHRLVGIEWLNLRIVWVANGGRFGSKIASANSKEVDGVGVGRVTQQIVKE